MKTLGTLLVLFSALMLVACQEKPVSPDTPYIIEGYVPNVEDGMEIALSQYLGNIYEVIARDTIENGKFYFKDQFKRKDVMIFYYCDFINPIPRARKTEISPQEYRSNILDITG